MMMMKRQPYQGGYSVEAQLVNNPPELDQMSPSPKNLSGCLSGERRTSLIIFLGVVATALFCCLVAGTVLYLYCEYLIHLCSNRRFIRRCFFCSLAHSAAFRIITIISEKIGDNSFSISLGKVAGARTVNEFSIS